MSNKYYTKEQMLKDCGSIDKINWDWISECQKLSEDFIKEFQDEVDWDYISGNQKLSEEFIKEFKDKVNWYCISEYQKLSEDFIKEFKDKVNWNRVSKYQKLSEEFILEVRTIPKLESEIKAKREELKYLKEKLEPHTEGN